MKKFHFHYLGCIVLLVCGIIHPDRLYAQDYAAGKIPEELLRNADAVVRDFHITFTVLNEGNARTKVIRAVTLLKEKASNHSILSLNYNKQLQVKSFAGILYDSQGREIDKIKTKDLLDIAAVNSGVLFNEERLLLYKPEVYTYPFTIYYEYETEHKGLLFYPDWRPQTGYNLSVEKSSMKVEYPQGLVPRHKALLLDQPEAGESPDGGGYLSWKAENLKALVTEPYSPPLSARVPCLYLAPGRFIFAGTSGDQASWELFGRWISGLNAGRTALPPETASQIREMVSKQSTRREKIRAVYKFVQEKTRYVNVEMGIGGFQPLEASFLDQKGYGDCKALTNYTMALLKEAGIESYYTVIRAGRYASEVLDDFPSQQFNHAILCVPDGNDTIWLECTDQNAPFGYIGNFTDNRKALVINGNKGDLRHTRVYTRDENLQITHAEVGLEADGYAVFSIGMTCSGLQYDNLSGLTRMSREDQRKHIYRLVDIPNFSLGDFSLLEEGEEVPHAGLTASGSCPGYLSCSGNRYFLPLNLMNRRDDMPPRMDDRRSGVYLSFAYHDIDSIEYILPPGLRVEYLPEKLDLVTDFGRYRSEVLQEQGRLVYVRELAMNKGQFPGERYADLVEFFRTVAKADNAKVLLTGP